MLREFTFFLLILFLFRYHWHIAPPYSYTDIFLPQWGLRICEIEFQIFMIHKIMFVVLLSIKGCKLTQYLVKSKYVKEFERRSQKTVALLC